MVTPVGPRGYAGVLQCAASSLERLYDYEQRCPLGCVTLTAWATNHSRRNSAIRNSETPRRSEALPRRRPNRRATLVCRPLFPRHRVTPEGRRRSRLKSGNVGVGGAPGRPARHSPQLTLDVLRRRRPLRVPEAVSDEERHDAREEDQDESPAGPTEDHGHRKDAQHPQRRRQPESIHI